jgi:DNA modification methylase
LTQLSFLTGPKTGSLDKLAQLLSQDLDFHDQYSNYATHDFHAFPAKFPPQLPRKFILELTNPGDVVLDPMMGSGTAVLEAYLAGRYGVGIDIDQLALKVSMAKVTPLDKQQVFETGKQILHHASFAAYLNREDIKVALETAWDIETINFINKWFAPSTQIELFALVNEIKKISNVNLRLFFEVVLSAIIITKSGGVSLAYDLAHTRPHLAKAIIDRNGEMRIVGNNVARTSVSRMKLLTKTLRSALEEFEKRFHQNLKSLLRPDPKLIKPAIINADAQQMPLPDDSVDLIVTSPPYASNAIDYMRSHKFSLVWLSFSIERLSKKRKEYIGGEVIHNVKFEKLPEIAEEVVSDIFQLDPKKGRALSRYYSEMTRTLREFHRVLKPGKAAILVVGSSTMRGRDTKIHTCLAEIGKELGFLVPKIGVRHLDRNRRMLPSGSTINWDSQIQQRMHEEYVIGFYKED